MPGRVQGPSSLRANYLFAVKRLGQVAKGMEADLVVLGADPEHDATAFSKVRYRIVGGKVIYSAK